MAEYRTYISGFFFTQHRSFTGENMDEITVGDAIQFFLSASALIGVVVTWRKSGAETIATLQETVSAVVADNQKIIEQNRILQKENEELRKINSNWKAGINLLVMQIRSYEKVPVWSPSRPEAEGEE